MDPRKELARLEARGERAYSDMYEAPNPTSAAGHYSHAKDYFAHAIGLAERAGLGADAERLRQRIASIHSVFREEFPR